METIFFSKKTNKQTKAKTNKKNGAQKNEIKNVY